MKTIFELFDFTCFFAWTFLNFLAGCGIPKQISKISITLEAALWQKLWKCLATGV